MSDDRFPRQPKFGELIWTLRKEGSTLSCELRGHGEFGWEIQLLRNGKWFYEHFHTTRAAAELQAAVARREYESQGWTT